MQEAGRKRESPIPRSKYLAGAAALILALAVLQAVRVVQLPIASWFTSVSGSILSTPTLKDFFSKYGYISLFVLMGLESASLPIPSEVVLPLAGYYVQLGAMNYWVAVLVGTAAALAGALVDYYLAKRLGRPFVVGLLRVFSLHREALDRAEGRFQKSGEWTVFAARFVPGLRTIISLPAGLFEMKLWTFIVMTLAGCVAWDAVLIYAGTLPGNSGFQSDTVVDALSIFVAAVSAAYIVYYVLPWVVRGPGRTTYPASES